LNGGALGGVTQVAASTVDAGAAAITVDGNDGAINLAGTLATTSAATTAVVIRDATTAALGNINAASGRVVLGQAGVNNLSGAVTQKAGTSIAAASLSTVGGSTVTLSNANQVGTLIASTPTGGLTLNNGNNALTVAGNVTATNSPVAISTGAGTYTQNNNVDVIAGTGDITVTADQVVLGTNGGNNALRTSGTLTLKPASPGQPMRVGSTAGADTPGTFDLRAAEITAFATGATGPIVIGDAAASTGTMTVAGPVNLAGKSVTLNAGSLADVGIQTITAQNLSLNARTGAIGGPGTPIDVAVTNLTVNTVNQNAHVSEANAVNLGPGASNLGAGGLDLVANGAITQTGVVTATGSSTLAAGAGNNITLTNLANDFGTVAVTSGNAVVLNDVNALTLGASSASTLTATAGGALSVNGVLTASGPGNSIVLSGTSFVNNVGAGALVVPGAGRWIVYSTDPAGNTFNSLASGNQAIWNATYVGNPPATIPAGNRYVFSTPAALTFTSTDASKVYGNVASVSGNYTVSGFVNAATYGNVFTQDTAANAFTGAPSVTSAGAPAIANAGVYPITVAAGSLVSTTGYTFAFNSAGQLTVSARPITILANNQSRAYGSANPTTGPYTITSGTLANADSITDVNVTSPATVLSGAGPYALTPTGANFGVGTATNYLITFTDGVLTVTPLPITVTANNQAKVYGQPDPVLTFTAPTVNGDVLNGTPVRAPGETVAGGPYAITQGTVTNALNPNYNITFVNGQLVITPANLTITADNLTRPYGDANPPLTATFTGLTNGDTAAAIPGVALATPAVPASNVGSYVITVTSGANTNYTITYVNGQLSITPAPLQIMADDKARLFGQPNPPFTATESGFKLGQTVADLNGTLVLASPATTASPAGAYPIMPSGVSSTNYAITFVDGILVVGQALLPADNALITATGRNVLMGSDEVPPGAVSNVDQCELVTSVPAQAGGISTAQRALNVAARGRPLGAPVCETPPQ
ncbi:MAG: MBG domain-containing protein, partial [Burkholderiales bacterium]